MSPTTLGFGAILLWATLALMTIGAGDIPPFQLNAMCFAIGGVVGLVWIRQRRIALRSLIHMPARIWALGVLGLFGYHFFYFTALQNAPPAEAGLIAYLWPLLIVLFSGLLPGERLRAGHILGASVAAVGAALLLSDGVEFQSGAAWGFASAMLCAFIWSGYSVLSRLAGSTPTEAVALFCLAASALSVLAHILLEPFVWPSGIVAWLSILGLGIGPLGLAFYVWDIGMKRGNVQVLGTASYAAPLLSTLLLVALGIAPLTYSLAIAALLITAGAGLAARASRG